MTAKEVYSRVRWDARIDSSRVKVGVEDRFKGIVELPFGDQKFGRDLQWHRIRYFHFDGRLVWSRDGTDLWDSVLQDTLPAEHLGHGFRSSPKFEAEKTLEPQSLRIYCHNVLADHQNDGLPSSGERFPSFLREFKSAAPDLAVLTEVTPKFLALLWGESWIVRNYYLSHNLDDKGLKPYGQIVLSRFPGTAKSLDLDAGKRLLLSQISFHDCPIQILGLHLSSQRSLHAEEIRRKQLDEILSHLNTHQSHILVGDFNHRGVLELPGFVDPWERLRPGKVGWTFDALTNELARNNSNHSTRARFDRFLLRGSWTARKIEVLRSQSSDHHGLLCELVPPLLQEPCYRSAICIIPPEKDWAPIQAIRKVYDPSFERWMPHINLIYGCLPELNFKDLAERLKLRLSGMTSFAIEASELAAFEHQKSTTVYLKPDPQSQRSLKSLQDEIFACLPKCVEQNERGNSGYNPHLTVAKFPRGQGTQLETPSLRFEASEICLTSRTKDGPFEVQERIALNSARPQDFLPPKSDRNAIWQELETCLEAQGLKCHRVGSEGLNLQLPWSDLDLLCIGEKDVESLLPGLNEFRLVHSRVPLLRGRWKGHKVDIQYFQSSNREGEASLPPGSQRALQSLPELERLKTGLGHPKAIDSLRLLRYWAHRRDLDRATLGFPGGHAWSILLYGCLEEAETSWGIQDILNSVFKTLANLPFRDSLPRFPVMSLTDPPINTAEQVTSSTRKLLHSEFLRAHSLSKAGLWEKLLELREWDGSLQIRAQTSSQREWGELESQLLSLLLEAERCGLYLQAHSPLEEQGAMIVPLSCVAIPAPAAVDKLKRVFKNGGFALRGPALRERDFFS